MDPLPETVEALNELDPGVDSEALLARLTELAERAQELVPDLVGVSVTYLDGDLTFTLVATTEEVAVLDAVQYAAGGPCVDSLREERVTRFRDDDALDEERWRLFAATTARRPVRSTLTLPIVADGDVTGSVNLYAASAHALDEHHEELGDLFGAWAAGAVSNADLGFTTQARARSTPARIRDQVAVDVAVGILSAELDLDVDAAEERLRDAADRARVTVAQLARTIVDARSRREPDDG